MSKTREAIRYALQRVVTDPDFRWHMMHTQTLRLLIQAEAEYRRVDEDVVESELTADIEVAAENGQPEAQLPAARKQIEKLERVVASVGGLQAALTRIEELETALDLHLGLPTQRRMSSLEYLAKSRDPNWQPWHGVLSDELDAGFG